MSNTIIVTGDGARLYFQLYIDGAKLFVPQTATVKVRLISMDHGTPYSAEVIQGPEVAGADWATGLIAVVLSEELTDEVLLVDDIDWGRGRVRAKMEIQIDDGAKETWFDTLAIMKGNIG